MERINLNQSNKKLRKTNLVVETIDYNNPYDFKNIHRHNYFELLLFENGEGGKQVIDFKEYTITSRTIYMILPGQVHLMKRLPKENGLLIQFTKEFFLQCIPKQTINHFNTIQGNPKLELSASEFVTLQNHFQQIRQLYNHKSQFQLDKLRHMLALIIFELFELLSIHNFKSQSNIAYLFIGAVEENFKTKKTVADYEALLQTPRKKISQAVKNQFGLSPLQVIHDVILLEIKRLLFVEELSHKEIAYHLNFDSQSSYNRFVKKMTSLTPMQLQASLTQIANQ